MYTFAMYEANRTWARLKKNNMPKQPHKPEQDKKVMGRPLKLGSVNKMKQKIEEYFATCDQNGKPYTVTGICLALDVARSTLATYEERKDKYGEIIRWAKLKCENQLEEGLVLGKTNPIGKIFSLKNNYGWTDKKEVESKGSIQINLVDYSEDTE